jgi:large subunit ribosomal protein L6
MSRIGKKPVPLPKGVEIKITENSITAKGPKGENSIVFRPEVTVKKVEDQVIVERVEDTAMHRALHGLTRSLVFNLIHGVSAGFEKQLEIVGVGYTAELKGQSLLLNLGFSHQILVQAPDGISYTVTSPTKITVSGHDKQKVGEVSALIRSLRPPEPYKGKGIKYAGERVRRKAGKAVKS